MKYIISFFLLLFLSINSIWGQASKSNFFKSPLVGEWLLVDFKSSTITIKARDSVVLGFMPDGVAVEYDMPNDTTFEPTRVPFSKFLYEFNGLGLKCSYEVGMGNRICYQIERIVFADHNTAFLYNGMNQIGKMRRLPAPNDNPFDMTLLQGQWYESYNLEKHDYQHLQRHASPYDNSGFLMSEDWYYHNALSLIYYQNFGLVSEYFANDYPSRYNHHFPVLYTSCRQIVIEMHSIEEIDAIPTRADSTNFADNLPPPENHVQRFLTAKEMITDSTRLSPEWINHSVTPYRSVSKGIELEFRSTYTLTENDSCIVIRHKPQIQGFPLRCPDKNIDYDINWEIFAFDEPIGAVLRRRYGHLPDINQIVLNDYTISDENTNGVIYREADWCRSFDDRSIQVYLVSAASSCLPTEIYFMLGGKTILFRYQNEKAFNTNENYAAKNKLNHKHFNKYNILEENYQPLYLFKNYGFINHTARYYDGLQMLNSIK